MTKHVWAVLLVVGLLLTGCGEGTSTSSSGDETETASEAPSSAPSEAAGVPLDEWVETALTECEAVNEATTAAEPKGDPFSPNATDADREQAVTFLSTFAESLRTFATNLGAAGMPDEKADAAQQLISSSEEAASAFDEAAAAAEQDFSKAQAAFGKAFGSIEQVSAAAAEVGIGDLEECKREAAKAEEPAAGANQVPVVAMKQGKKYTFKFDQVVPAGKTAFVMENADDEPHFMALVQVKGPGDLAKAIAAEGKGDSKTFDKLVVNEDVGGSEDAGPGGQAVANVDLKPGTYGMMCFIPGPDGKPHAFSGMAVEFEVK